MSKSIIIEVAANSLKSALNAEAGGADRIELCTNLELGGTTPSAGLISMVNRLVKVPVHVLIRPRAGDFFYNKADLEVIRRDIVHCESVGIAGVVLGFLNLDGTIDQKLTEEMAELAAPMKVTFHRAFDFTPDIRSSLEAIKEIPVHRVLTSGGAHSSIEGREVIRELIRYSGEDLIILPGGGLTADNIREFVDFTGAKEVHLSGKKAVPTMMEFKPEHLKFIDLESISEYDHQVSDKRTIQDVVEALK